MGRNLPEVESLRRRERIVAGLRAGKSLNTIGREMGVNPGSVYWLLKKYNLDVAALSPDGKRVHGNSKAVRSRRPTTTAERLAMRKTQYNLGSKTERWQTADPAQFPDDIITEAQRLLNCDRAHAAWVLSCPSGGNAHGWRGGSAIG